MSKSWRPRLLVAAFTTFAILGGTALAQKAPTVRIRGTIEAIDGNTLSIKTREGTDAKVNITDDIGVIGMEKASLSDVKQGAYIGVSAMPQPDGVQKALSVHIFPETMRGVAEGFGPWDLRPNSTMTNATVADTVAGVDGQDIQVKYKDGEKKVVVPPDTPIVAFVKGDKSEIKPGARIIIFGAKKMADGTLETNRIGVGRDGITPPM